MLQTASRSSVHYVEAKSQTNPDVYILTSPQEGPFLHTNDANENGFVTFFFALFLMHLFGGAAISYAAHVLAIGFTNTLALFYQALIFIQ